MQRQLFGQQQQYYIKNHPLEKLAAAQRRQVPSGHSVPSFHIAWTAKNSASLSAAAGRGDAVFDAIRSGERRRGVGDNYSQQGTQYVLVAGDTKYISHPTLSEQTRRCFCY